MAGEGTTPEDRLREWYRESLTELGVMARSAVVNRMYEAPKLVVEGRGRVMVSGGGGAGAEAGLVNLPLARFVLDGCVSSPSISVFLAGKLAKLGAETGLQVGSSKGRRCRDLLVQWDL